MGQARLITIGFSHYCEKARWALDYAGVPYVEDDHAPLFHWAASFGAGGGRTVPVLVTPEEGVLKDSTDILAYADRKSSARKLFPEALRVEALRLEDDFDRQLGPATRRLLYHHLLADTATSVKIFKQNGPRWEAQLAGLMFPFMRTMLRRGLRIDDEGARRSQGRIEATFAQVAERLKDGRKYLLGDVFTGADLTFAALAAPVLLPPQYGFTLPSTETLNPASMKLIDDHRRTPAGAYALRLYSEDRVRG